MRRWLLLCVLAGLPAARGQAQENVLEKKVFLHLSQTTLENALQMISRETGVEFSYSDDLVPTQAPVEIVAEGDPLHVVLKKLVMEFGLEYKVSHSRIILKKAPAPLTQTIRGKVVDRYTSFPVPGAAVIYAHGLQIMGAISDEDGAFRILNVPVGRVTLSVTCVGYNARTLPDILLGTGKELILEIKLTESVVAMDEVVVEAQRFSRSSANNTFVSARSFSMEETKRYAGSMGDPARMASGFAGVTGASDESNALTVRGNSPRGVLWRADGIEVPNPNHFTTEGSSSGVVSILSPNIVDYSDFLTGAFPAQYGNALSAVFDIKLREGNNERREHSFQAGLLGIEASTEGPFSKHDRSSYLVNYRYSSLSIVDKLGFDLRDAGQYKDYQDLSFKLSRPTAQGGNLSVFGIGGLSRSDKTGAYRQDERHSDVGVAGLNYLKVVNERTSLKTGLSFSGTRISRQYELAGQDAGPLKLLESYTKSYTRASAGITKKLSPGYLLEGGVIYSRLYYKFYLQDLDPGNPTYQEIINFRERDDTGIMQGYFYSKQSFSKSLHASYGLHFIRFGLTHDQSLEPRAALQWELTPRSALAVSYGKHSRIENLQYYLARDHQAGGNEVQINRGLGFTRSHHFGVSGRQRIKGNHLIHAEVYYQQLYNVPVQSDLSSLYVTLNEDSGFVTDTLINNGRGKNYGAELSVSNMFENNFYYLANATLYRSLFRIGDGPERNTSYNGNYTIHLLLGREFRIGNGKEQLSLNGRITGAGGKRYVPIDADGSVQAGYAVYDWEKAFEPQMPGYFRADLQLTYKKNKPRYSVEWRLDIQNITDRGNAAYYFFDAVTGQVSLKRQVGILPILTYRIEF